MGYSRPILISLACLTSLLSLLALFSLIYHVVFLRAGSGGPIVSGAAPSPLTFGAPGLLSHPEVLEWEWDGRTTMHQYANMPWIVGANRTTFTNIFIQPKQGPANFNTNDSGRTRQRRMMILSSCWGRTASAIALTEIHPSWQMTYKAQSNGFGILQWMSFASVVSEKQISKSAPRLIDYTRLGECSFSRRAVLTSRVRQNIALTRERPVPVLSFDVDSSPATSRHSALVSTPRSELPARQSASAGLRSLVPSGCRISQISSMAFAISLAFFLQCG